MRAESGFPEPGNGVRYQWCRTDCRKQEGSGVAFEVIDAFRADKRQPACAKHCAELRNRLRHGVRIEKNEAQRHKQQRINVLQDMRSLQQPAVHQLLCHQQDRKAQPPQNKVPACPVPQTGQHPDNENVPQPFCLRYAVSAERNIDVVPEPGAEADMPAPPEFGDGAGDIRVVEILLKPETENSAESDCHIAVAGKVKIELQGKAHGVEPEIEDRQVPALLKRRDQLIQNICQQHLFR